MARVETAPAGPEGAAPPAAERVEAPAPSPARGKPDFWRVSLLSLGHGGNDMYAGMLNPVLPLFYLAGRITLTEVGIISLLYSVCSSLLQPLFGYLSDRTGRRWLVYCGPAWTALCLSLIGIAPNVAIFVALAVIGGIGSAAFHPQASSMVNAVSGNRRALAMSIFQLGGNVGFALGPVLVAYLANVGLERSVTLMPLGLIVAFLLFLWAPNPNRAPRPAGTGERYNLWQTARPHLKGLSLVVLVVALRTAVTSGLLIVFPLYLKNQGMEFGEAQLFSTVVLGAGSVGAMYGSYLADRLGYKQVMVSTLVLTSAALTLFAVLHPVQLWVLFALLIGVLVLSSSSLSVVMAQDLLPRSTGMAAGLTLGFGFGLGGMVSAAYTITADHLGLAAAVAMLVLTPLVAAGAAAAIPTRRALA